MVLLTSPYISFIPSHRSSLLCNTSHQLNYLMYMIQICLLHSEVLSEFDTEPITNSSRGYSIASAFEGSIFYRNRRALSRSDTRSKNVSL